MTFSMSIATRVAFGHAGVCSWAKQDQLPEAYRNGQGTVHVSREG